MGTKCLCPSIWQAELGGMGPCTEDLCPVRGSCGGWNWDRPPCGGCDECITAQWAHYSPQDFTAFWQHYDAWRTAQVMNA